MPAKPRAYTMKELKGIVEYLTEHNVYSEVRGRKMWMDYASTGLTTRTWQSLKETFLKRILPDIHNPYYNLSSDQIRSFRTGQDVTNKNVNKLDIHTSSNDESGSKDNNTAGGQPSTSYNAMKEEGNTSGEENELSKVTSSRESVDTVILSTGECYNDAELLRVLESPAASPQTKRDTVPKKTMTLRDCITYMEPLTPLLQEIVDDFESEPEENIIQPVRKTQNEPTEKTVAKPDIVDLTNDIQSDQEEPPVVQFNKVTEVSESSTKNSMKLGKDDKTSVAEVNNKSKKPSSETAEIENEITGPQQIVQNELTEVSKATRTNSSDGNQVENSVLKEINKDIANKSNNTEIVALERNNSVVQDVEKSVSVEINNDEVIKISNITGKNTAEIVSSEVHEVQNIVTKNINKNKINKLTTKPKDLCVELKNAKSQEQINRENTIDSLDTNGTDKRILEKNLADKINENHTDKSFQQTAVTSVHTEGSDLQITENAIVETREESTTSKTCDKDNDDSLPKSHQKLETTSGAKNCSEVATNSVLETQNSNRSPGISAPDTQNSNKTIQNSDSLLPNNQEALVKNNDKGTSEEQRSQMLQKQELTIITTEKDRNNSKEEHPTTIQNAEKQTNEGFKKSQKWQRKLYSETVTTIAISKVKSVDGVNEESEDEQPSSPQKHKPIGETANLYLESPKQTNIPDCKSGKAANPIPAVIPEKSVEAQQEDITDTQESQQSTNPCLQSVSLFAEQFIPLKSDSDDDDDSLNSPVVNKEQDQPVREKNEEVPKRILFPELLIPFKGGKGGNDSLKSPVAGKEKEQPAEKNNEKPQRRKILRNEVFDSSNSSNKTLVTDADTNLVANIKQTLLLNSHSDSETTEDIQLPRKRTHRDISRRERKEVLSHLFGTSSGRLIKKRQRPVNGSVHRKNYVRISSDSSEWVSESDDEFVSPPRCRHRSSKRYRKPQSSRILQMRQEGALFVAVGKKVYPLVRDDGRAVSYVNYVSGSESEENDSYWKLKYVKERKRNHELSKLLENAPDKCADKRTSTGFQASPILPCKSSKMIRHLSSDGDVVVRNEKFQGTSFVLPKEVTIKDKEDPMPQTKETVKIKFAKQNEELCLEGHWQNLHSILSDVMQVFKPDALPGPSKSKARKKEASPIDVSSGKTTPLTGVVDDEVHKKVDEIEGEIFKEIEEIDKSEKTSPSSVQGVTVRKRRQPKKLTVDDSPTPSTDKSKRAKTSDTDTLTSSNKKTLRPAKTVTDPAVSPAKRKAQPKTPKEPETPAKPDTIASSIKKRTRSKVSLEAETATEKQARSRTVSRSEDGEIIVNESRLQLIDTGAGPSKRIIKPPAKLTYDDDAKPPAKDSSEEATIPDDSQVKYKFPSPVPDTGNVKARAPRTKKYLPRTPHIYSDCTQNSLGSSQGYQDSDFSPLSGNFRRKKKYTLPTNKARGRNKFSRNFRRHAFDIIDGDASSESSNTNFRFPIRNVPVANSSLDTEAYRSESYQLLVPKPNNFFPLERISESPCPNEVDPKSGGNCLKLSPASQNLGSELASTSSVSFPMSPELSIVEHISVDKNKLQRQPEHPTINETIGNVEMKSVYRDSYILSDVDISVPLMQQPCHFRIYQDSPRSSNLSVEVDPQSAQITERGITVMDSLLNRMDQARLEKTTDDLDLRLTNLLLESAKKIATQNQKANEALEEASAQKKKLRKSSTPRKKRETKKSATPSVPVIEECMEYCYSGRKSCPPVICENTATVADMLQTPEAKRLSTKKTRTPKEIIKVKITRPKNKNKAQKPKKLKQSQSVLSVLTDSGITDTSVSLLLHSTNDSVALIHNHSETCLNANECLDDVEKSQGSIDSSISQEDAGMKRRRNVRDSMTPEFFCSDAQSASSFDMSRPESSTKASQSGVGFLSVHYSSLITEDLSDEQPLTKEKDKNWYLLSEDESTNTLQSFPKPATCSMSSSYGSNLRKLFPVICSVPDLSDITEFSKEADVNSPKSTRNTDIDSNLRSEFLLSDFHDDFVANTNN